MSETARRDVRLDPDALAALEEQRDFLTRSLRDLEREHEAGDLDAGDYQTLKDDYERRLARVTRAVDEGKAELIAAGPHRSRGRTAMIVAGVVVFAILCGVFVARAAGRRDTGQEVSGAVTATARERNTQCLSEARTDAQSAIKCYSDVLAAAPQNVEALTYRGWIRFVNGDTAGVNDLFQAVKVDGTYPDVHAFLAVVLFQSGCVSDAGAELQRLDALNPSPLIQQQVDSLRQQIAAAASTSTTAAVASSSAGCSSG